MVSDRITDETFHTLVNLVYEAACDPTRWPQFLDAIACAIGGRGAGLFQHNFTTMEGSTATNATPLNVAVGMDPEFLRSYEEHYSYTNVWARNESAQKEGRVVTGSMLFPLRDLPKTEWYSDWLRPQDYCHLIGGVVVRDGSWATHFSSLRSRGSGDYDSTQIRLCQALYPHLARAVRIQRRFAFLQDLSTSSLAVLDTLPVAVMLLDASSRVWHLNAAAETEMRRGDPFRRDPSGEIRVRGASHTQTAVRRAIGAAIDPVRGVQDGVPTVAQVSRRNGEILTVQALPLPRSNQNAVDRRVRQLGAACAFVVHGSISPVPTVGVQLLRHIYGLTPAEIQVALAVAEGETLKQYAERRRISRNTAASQLKRAFAKTGLTRQSELVRWLLMSGAALRPGTSRQ